MLFYLGHAELLGMKQLDFNDFVDMGTYVSTHPIKIDLAYAREDNLLFGERIYRPDAKLWLHKDLAKVVLRAAEIAQEKYGYHLVLFDGLRTTTAQEKMLQTQRVKDNPHWLEEPRLLSPPGAGAHPRGMAIDVSFITPDGELVDMGTPFDYLAESPHADKNPAHREYKNLSPDILARRGHLEDCFNCASKETGIPVIGLQQEWWDFRQPESVYGQYAPKDDLELPEHMRMVMSS